MGSWENAFTQQILELSLSEEDVEELRSERTIKNAKVTNEEIEKLVIDENLSEFERLVFILKSGQDIQKQSAIAGIPTLLLAHPDIELEVVELLKTVLLSVNKEILIVTGKSFLDIIQRKLIDLSLIGELLLNNMLVVLENRDTDVCVVWMDVLLASLNYISKDNLIDKILPFLISSGSLTQCFQRRQICCRLVSHIVEYVDIEMLCSKIIPQMKAFCQDIELEIRSSMCLELANMFTKVPKAIGEQCIFPELCLLLQDEEATVRHSALSTITRLMPQLSQDLIDELSLTKLCEKFYRNALLKKQPRDLITAAQFIGKIIYYLSDHLSDEDKSLYLDYYQVLCCQGSSDNTKEKMLESSNIIAGNIEVKNDSASECRYWCAFNFPALLLSIPVSSFKSLLLPSFIHLTRDNHPMVRRTIYCCLHEVGNILSSDVHMIFNSIKSCLKEKDIEVLDGVLTYLPQTLKCLHAASADQDYVGELIPYLVSCEATLSNSLKWRTHKKFLESMACFHRYVSRDIIYSKIVPMMINVIISEKVLPVRQEAAHTLLTYLKHNRCFEERREVCSKLIAELARSSSCRSRLLFLNICRTVVEYFSKNFFKDNFYDVTMELATDPVVNVRMKFCELLPLLKSQIRLPSDRLMLQILEQTIRRIMALENDPDVSCAVRKAIIDLDNVHLSMDGLPQTNEDKMDIEKEKDELAIYEEYRHRRDQEQTGRHRAHSLVDKPESSKRRAAPPNATARDSKKVSLKQSPLNSVVTPAKKSGSSKSKESAKTFQSTSGSKLTTKKSSSHSSTGGRRCQK